MTQRTDQVASTLKRATQEILSRGLADPRVQGLITVTRVDVSADLANATLFCSVTPHKHEELSMHGLKSASKWVRRQVSDKVRFRRMPKFIFKVDVESVNTLNYDGKVKRVKNKIKIFLI